MLHSRRSKHTRSLNYYPARPKGGGGGAFARARAAQNVADDRQESSVVVGGCCRFRVRVRRLHETPTNLALLTFPALAFAAAPTPPTSSPRADCPTRPFQRSQSKPSQLKAHTLTNLRLPGQRDDQREREREERKGPCCRQGFGSAAALRARRLLIGRVCSRSSCCDGHRRSRLR